MAKWPWIDRPFTFDYPYTKYPDLLERVRGAIPRLEDLACGLPPEDATKHDGRGWSIQENVGHLADVESLWLGRMDDYEGGAEVLRPADMTNLRTHEAHYDERPFAEVVAAFKEARSQLIGRLEQLPPEGFDQAALHPRLGKPMRIVDLLYFAAEHDDYHLARIRELIETFSAARKNTADGAVPSVGTQAGGKLELDARAGYDLWASLYDEEDNSLVLLEEPIVRGWLANPAGLTVADVGCGTGRHAIWLAEQGASVSAFDASTGMMAKAQEKLSGHGVTFIEHELPRPLPVEDGTFDVALLALVADHLEELEPTFRDLARILKPGGRVIFTVLHPAMNLLGLTARFTDPTSGREVRVEAYEHTHSAYVLAALRAGLEIEDLVERRADADLVEQTERARKYLNWPMLLAMRLKKGG